MACTCQTITAALRMPARRIASPAAVRAVASRSFTSYSPYRAPAAAAQPAAASGELDRAIHNLLGRF